MRGLGEDTQAASGKPDDNLQSRNRDGSQHRVRSHCALFSAHGFGAENSLVGHSLNYHPSPLRSQPRTAMHRFLRGCCIGPVVQACATIPETTWGGFIEWRIVA